jgi:hypothetical protein
MSAMKVLGKTHWGGKLLRVLVPPAVYEHARDIQERIRSGEINRQGSGKQEWEAKVMPSIRKALGDYELDELRDQVWIRPKSSVSRIAAGNRKRKKIHAPDTHEVLRVYESRKT